MSRPLRPVFAGALYHLRARGNAGEAIVRDDADRLLFLDGLAGVVSRFRFVVHAYCLMGNHYHVVVATPGANLPGGVRHLNGTYAQRFNRRHGRTGHVFEGRYRATVVGDDRYLLALARYVVRNPVRAGLCDDPAAWPWSSCRATAGLSTEPGFLDTGLLLGLVGGEEGSARLRYLAWVRGDEDGDGRPEDEARGGIYLGDRSFATRASRAGAPSAEVPREQREPVAPPLAALLANPSDAAIASTHRAHGYTLAAIAATLAVHPSTVSRRLHDHEAGRPPRRRRRRAARAA